MENEKEKKEKSIYCPIYNGPAEETGKPTWAYCTTHGWVKYKWHDEKGSEDLLSKINLRASILTKQTEEKIDGIRKKSPLIGYIVPAIFVTVLIGFLAGSFFWRDTANKSPEVRQTELPDQKEVPSQKVDQTIDTQPLVSVSPNEPVAADLNEKKEDKAEKKIEEKSIQSHIDLPIAVALSVAFVASAANVVRGQGPLWFDSLAMLVAALLGARQLQRGAQRAALERADSLRGVAFLEFARRLTGDGPDAPGVEVPLAALAPGDRWTSGRASSYPSMASCCSGARRSTTRS